MKGRKNKNFIETNEYNGNFRQITKRKHLERRHSFTPATNNLWPPSTSSVSRFLFSFLSSYLYSFLFFPPLLINVHVSLQDMYTIIAAYFQCCYLSCHQNLAFEALHSKFHHHHHHNHHHLHQPSVQISQLFLEQGVSFLCLLCKQHNQQYLPSEHS